MKIINYTFIALISIFFTGCTSSTVIDEIARKSVQSKQEYCQKYYFSAAASRNDRNRSAVRCNLYAEQVYEERGPNGPFSERSADEINEDERRGRAN